MSPAELRTYVEIMREHNVLVFESNGVRIALGPEPIRSLQPGDPDAPKPPPKPLSYNDLLFAATEGLPEDDE